METAGYFASLLIGISLGLIGGGGSILTVPVMVYLFGLPPLLATSYSLFIVGATSFVGAAINLRKGLVNIKSALLFGASSVAAVFFTRKFLVPAIPENLFSIGSIPVTASLLTMLLFAVLMLLASLNMIRTTNVQRELKECRPCFRFGQLIIYGIAIGVVTGLLGAGGGFLLIPALVLLLKLPMKKAIGTSLLIIALNSLFGFIGDLGHVTFQWPFLLAITAIAIAGIFIGGALSKKISSEKLKKGFGWFVLVMGLLIVLKETVFK